MSRDIARLSMIPSKLTLLVTKYNLREGHTYVHKKMFFLFFFVHGIWLARVYSTSIVYKRIEASIQHS